MSEQTLCERVQAALHDRILLKVSRATGVSKTTLHRIRQGGNHAKGPQTRTLKTLADYLGIKP
jgi:transcriptional regulator with XRE-family HTH domain